MQANTKYVVTADHEHSQFQKNYQRVTGLLKGLDRNRIFYGGDIWAMKGKAKWWRKNGPPELSLTGRFTTAEVVTSHLYSVRVWYLTVQAGQFSCCS
ncbi:hypothetical protein EVAR_24623_1 [Eumeta japonica]|uniref:Uncharacterized protein n=1 Tax=Eumeta variegata TaxID=151549 RepID=A0A4C1V1R2_EUMVA|nr:hypothetical protein EVAR_24623_1 [Eumeta japonica]